MPQDNKKTPRPKAETPKGFRDYFGADVTERKAMLDRLLRRSGARQTPKSAEV